MAGQVKGSRESVKQPLRITTWPLGELRPGFGVNLPGWPGTFRKGEWAFHRSLCVTSDAPPPDDIHLRQALDTELADLDALLGIAAAMGGEVRTVERDYALNIALYSESNGREWHPSRIGLATDDPRELADKPRDVVDLLVNLGTAAETEFGSWVHLDSIAWQLNQLRVIGLFCIATKRGESLLDAYMAWGHSAQLDWKDHPKFAFSQEPPNEADAIERMTSLMNDSLRPWSPHVWQSKQGQDEGYELDRPDTILAVGALQAFNDLVSDIAYTSCAHCSRWYGKQIGRAKSRSRTQGVIYCSRSCANAASQMKYRKRQKERRRTVESGGR